MKSSPVNSFVFETLAGFAASRQAGAVGQPKPKRINGSIPDGATKVGGQALWGSGNPG
jgi:hypothetical protein